MCPPHAVEPVASQHKFFRVATRSCLRLIYDLPQIPSPRSTTPSTTMSVDQLRPLPTHFRLKDLAAISAPVFQFKSNPHQEDALRTAMVWLDRYISFHLPQWVEGSLIIFLNQVRHLPRKDERETPLSAVRHGCRDELSRHRPSSLGNMLDVHALGRCCKLPLL